MICEAIARKTSVSSPMNSGKGDAANESARSVVLDVQRNVTRGTAEDAFGNLRPIAKIFRRFEPVALPGIACERHNNSRIRNAPNVEAQRCPDRRAAHVHGCRYAET